MQTSLDREKCLKNLGEAMKMAGWVLAAMAQANTGVDGSGLVDEKQAQEALECALEDVDRAMEALQEVRDHLQAQVPTEQSAAAC